MSMISRMSSTLTFPGTLRSMCTGLGELVVQGKAFLLLCMRVTKVGILCVIYVSCL